MVAYTRSFQHQDWIDNQDIVQAGGERGFNVEFHSLEAEFDKIGTVIAQLNAGLGAFQPVGAGGAVAYGGGNVGVGANFLPGTPPTYRLEVDLAPNTASSEQVRFGNSVCCNGGAGAFSAYAVFSHRDHAADSGYALRQGPNGNVHVNATAGQPISFRQNGTSIRMAISPAGNLVLGAEADLPGAGTAQLQVAGDAFKLTGSASWLVPSDVRLKENIRDLDVGLKQLQDVRPVRFRYNGRAGTPTDRDYVGVIGQEIEKIFPDMIRKMAPPDDEPSTEELRIYDSSALTYVLVNAVKELASRVEHLEQALAEQRGGHHAEDAMA